MNTSSIRWTNVTWNAIHGCSKVSNGCAHCYAMELSLKRGWTKAAWTIQNEEENVMMKPHKLHEPFTLKEPSRVFVNSMSDMFHRTVSDWYRAAMWCVMLATPQHTYQILTKRTEARARPNDGSATEQPHGATPPARQRCAAGTRCRSTHTQHPTRHRGVFCI